MNRCKTCRWWDQSSGRLSPSGSTGRGGDCSNEGKLHENYVVQAEDDHLVYSYNEGGGFWTGPEFGCVHHEARP
jgi:hypothetical protein